MTSTLFKKQRSWQAMEFRDGKFTDMSEFGRIHMINLELILPNTSQPRRVFDDDALIRLADSIRTHGMLQPVVVRKRRPDEDLEQLFEIIAGERRLRAAKLIGMEKIPCIIMDADARRSAELAIIENIQREDLNFFEQASAIAALIDMYRLTQDEIAQRLSVSQSYVANKLRLLRFSAEEREKVLRYALTERHARALLRISSTAERLRAIEHIHTHALNVAATEAYIERYIAQTGVRRVEKTPRRVALKDIRVFYNSVDRAISTIKQAGVNVETERIDENGVTVLTIRIPNNVSRETL